MVHKSQWISGVNDENNIADSLKINIQIKAFTFSQTNGLYIHTETSVLDNLTGNYHLVLYLIRNDVVSPQKFDQGIIDTNYHHHAILSDNINGTWGTAIINGSALKDSIIYNDFSYQLPDPVIDMTYETGNLSLIGYILNRDNMRVLQVVKKEL